MIVIKVIEDRRIIRRDSFCPGAVREDIRVRIRFCDFIKLLKHAANTRLSFLKAGASGQHLPFAQANYWPLGIRIRVRNILFLKVKISSSNNVTQLGIQPCMGLKKGLVGGELTFIGYLLFA